MRDRWLIVVGVIGAVVLLAAGVGVAAMAGAFSSSSSAATTTALTPAGNFGGAPRGGFGDGDGSTGRGLGGGGRGGAGGIFGSFNAAATYLGVSTTQLFTDIRGGKTLAQIATAQGKSTTGLISAMVTAEKQSLASAVSAGQLTQAQEQQIEGSISQRIAGMVNGTFTRPGAGRGGFRGGGLGGAPPTAQA